MHPKFVKLRRTLSDAIAGMNIDDLSRHPEGKWSTAEILDHLNLTYLGTIKNLERRIAEGKTCPEGDRRKSVCRGLPSPGSGICRTGESRRSERCRVDSRSANHF